MTTFRLLATAALFASAPALAQTTWVDRTSLIISGNNNTTGIAYTGSRFLLVTTSGSGTYWRSAAGTSNWSFSSLPSRPTSYSSNGIASGNGVTVVTGVKNTLHTTSAADPVEADWTKQNPAVRTSGTPDLYRVRYLNGLFVVGTANFLDSVTPANSYTEVLTSPDGVTWTSRKFSYASLGNNLYNIRDIAFKPGATAGTGTWVFGTNSDFILTAPENFSSATRVSISSIGNGPSLVYGAGLFVLATNNGSILTSPSGATATWTERTLPVATASLNAIFHDGTTFVAVGATVTGSSPARPTVLNSTDGIAWTEAATVPAGSQPLISVFKADGLWLAGGNIRTLLTSGSSSVSAPSFSPPPAAFSGSTGGTITLTATAIGAPAPTVQWYRGTTALADDARISGSATGTLTITGATFADAGAYFLRATNSVGTTDSSAATVSLNATAGGAVFSPYGQDNTLGGSLIPGASPARSAIGGIASLFTVGSGATSLPNVTLSGTSYTLLGGVSPDGTRLLLNPSSGNKPPVIYDLATSTATPLANIAFPLGSITSVNSIGGTGLANNGNVTGSLNDQSGNLHAFHYSASTQTYTLLGLVPNATNDRATSAGGISADGTTVSGYERISTFNGPFIWTTTGGFTLLPQPANGGAVNGDIRQISPNARFIVGQGTAAPAFGSGVAAMRWDRGNPVGVPAGFALPSGPGATYADARTVNNNGAAGGTVRIGLSFTDSRAAVWLPSGALINLPDYLASTYGLTTPGYVLNQVTSISDDLRTIAGTATNAAALSDGWILTLPAPLAVASVPNVAVRRSSSDLVSGSAVAFGSYQIGASLYLQQTLNVRNDGTGPLNGLSATITGPDAADFTYVLNSGLSDPIPESIGLNEFVTIYTRFAPHSGTAGPRTATLTITSNDPDTASFVVNLSGTATAPSAFASYLINANVPANQRGTADDPDADGVTNLVEFALGMFPLTPATQGLPVAAAIGNNLILRYVRAQPAAITYTVETTGDLTTNSWTAIGVSQGAPDADGVTTASIPIAGGAKFLRLRVILNP
jgi:Immunoglobulin I-set domain